jgi:HEAT repeat protein
VLCLGMAASASGPRLALPYSRTVSLTVGQVVEISAGVESPSQLPPNGRLAVEWTAPGTGAGFRKILHALDPDIYLVYRAPVTGTYTLSVKPVEKEAAIFNLPRWQESGAVQAVNAFPELTPWPQGTKLDVHVTVRDIDYGISKRGMIVETEPNNSIAQAQPIPLADGDSDQTIHIIGGADDIEYFDNGLVDKSGDDWFRIEYKGSQTRLLTCNLVVTDPFVVARVRFYTADGKEYKTGMNANERVHQQTEEHRTEINRMLKPGGVYFLRAEANSPGYDLELRIRRPAPYTDPRDAVRQAMYDHIAQVDAWLMNRPRGASVERRIRDTGNLLGTQCMSCHTQSGVWGPAVPLQMGYRIENVQNYRHLINVMYESLRLTNVLKDAANNTSLQPLDLGDGPAGTRVAGHNVTTLETVIAPRKLHSMQQIRAANFVLQSNDPSGVNAAGPGSNVGQAVVFHYAGEILRRAWDKTGEARYLEALEEKAEKMLGVAPKYADDFAHRVLFFRRVLPKQSLADSNFRARVASQLAADEQTLRKSQRGDGTWGFAAGVADVNADPSPTALALDALQALGFGPEDPAIKEGVAALLRMQDPYGRWNRAALTGFVTTAYALNTLARLFPEESKAPQRADYAPVPGESLNDTIARFRALAQLDHGQFLDLMLPGAAHTNPQVRYWAMIALGAQHSERAVRPLIAGLGDRVKMVREAARWGLRQTLLDDKGWPQVWSAYQKGGDLTREQLAAALILRADATLTKSKIDFSRLTNALDHMINDDRNPAVRAWASRAAWNWWIWNPPAREGINQALLRELDRQESSVLAANAQRYQLQALFIANGHRANGSVDHQYPELAKLFEAISKKLDHPNDALVDRIVGAAGTYYNTAGGDGGPGQMGYTTPHSAEMVGKAVMAYWNRAEAGAGVDRVRLALESAANATYEPMQKRLLDYALNGPENLRTVAATSVSDPRSISLPATQEFVEPLVEQARRGAGEPSRRDQLSKPIFRLFTRAHWSVPKTEEQQRIFLGLLTPKLDDPKSDAQWYLADQFGQIIGANPDLHMPTLLAMVPKTFRNALEEHFWLPSVKWMLSYGAPVPEVGRPAASSNPPELREAAIALYLKQLSPEASKQSSDLAIRMASLTGLRSDPRVLAALAHVSKSTAERYDPQNFERELQEAIAADSAERKPAMSDLWMRNFAYFRDYVIPEMARPNRDDEVACFGCHGVAGRVPSMPLTAPDRSGYLSAKDTWKDYRILLERINESDVETSKLLRKPLNIQTGKEDGHQGGRRYTPGDRGYEIIKRWAADVAALRQAK